MPPEPDLPPFGRRQLEVASTVSDGGYQVVTLIDREGPEPFPGQFYMLAEAPDWGGADGRPYLPRAISWASSTGVRGDLSLDFLLDRTGPGTVALTEMEAGRKCWVAGPFGRGFSPPGEVTDGSVGAILVGGGIGIAPIAAWRTRLAGMGIPVRTLLGFRDVDHSGAIDRFFGCEEVRLAFEDGSSGHHGYVTDLLVRMLSGDDPGGAAVYACGPPAMLEAVRTLCLESGVGSELALESPMACGFGACFGCAVPLVEGGYMRLCIDGPVVRGDRITTAMAGEK